MAQLFSYGPKNIREFVRTNLPAILYTVIFHLAVAIVLVLFKVQGLNEDRELGVMLDFSDETTLEEMLNKENIDIPAEWIEQVYDAREQASNRAVNLDDLAKSDISTEDYVNQLLDELEAQKDEKFLEDREKWREIISSYVYEKEPLDQAVKKDEEDQPFTGPTNITYSFKTDPKDRKKRELTIPVYRCEGSALVVIDLGVRQDGSVSGTSLVSVETINEPDCFIEAAENAALTSRFYSDFNAPEKHVARVTYQFIAQ
ncbi:MAG: hypothetical protein K9J30_02125 [Bacteroidales bacterium]|nr:hypothetical protein [Bacteroidales bacterium]